ncbi:flagellar basal body L-ring protein FlgH [Halobacteriovorax sp.]|uniref:flagellar basal body L-ring protein FlgH n=1 Tax=Halobacteriovorax sp. TaxID=2020862 RepID=UPI003561F329
MKFIKLVLILSTALLFSCSNYINKMYSDLDRQDMVRNQQPVDAFEKYKNPPTSYRRGTDSGRIATAASNQPYYNRNQPPRTRRDYKPTQNLRKRYKADDLLDNSENKASLWAGKGNDRQLFTVLKDKRNGDIVLINVQKTLKNDITLELKRAFPELPKPAGQEEKKEDTEKSEDAITAADKNENNGNKIYDRVSSVIVEEINEDHLLLRGQKSVLFQQRKRLVEIQALISRRDITDEDTINSDNILESSVHILR